MEKHDDCMFIGFPDLSQVIIRNTMRTDDRKLSKRDKDSAKMIAKTKPIT